MERGLGGLGGFIRILVKKSVIFCGLNKISFKKVCLYRKYYLTLLRIFILGFIVMKTLKKINLRAVSETLSDRELKNVPGGTRHSQKSNL
jgi:natural product precursor